MTDEEVSEQSAQVWDKLFDLQEYQQAKSVGLFLSMPRGEIKTEVALKRAIQDDKLLYVPQVGENFEQADMEMLRVENVSKDTDEMFYEAWPKNKWGIPEPPKDRQLYVAGVGDIDLMVVPGLGFDDNGGRLGQGKGYYDRFIARARKDGMPALVAVGLKPQMVDEIPTSEHDFQMDIVLTPTKTIRIK
eukprot:CAMPEP_0118673826 /NCGR_PEP_ID=MMETSP0800-20121206/547_1 /TAXON_ID=210618 ORGANISM="Striatella unipunctata, Strain CCMP2910" /NCGR_SAMPLE_ID=MMETSP0800 /ASSEMBLY_ACC=CAM_ASM_000638 /LENGTH=188 /DNA_ID=CAMNT_0006568951 /DNA_START=1 /DNA_END=567 /DNA_ORIENTATION=-